MWSHSTRGNPEARAIADRHYNRQKIGATQFMPPGRCMVLLAQTETGQALWGTSWPFAQYVKHDWAGAWMCSIFRNEGAGLSSKLIRQAVAATRAYYGDPPELGMITFVDPRHVRDKNDPGHCFIIAGFRPVGITKDQNLVALQLLPERMPEPMEPVNFRERIAA